jgi:hypothetical protein
LAIAASPVRKIPSAALADPSTMAKR